MIDKLTGDIADTSDREHAMKVDLGYRDDRVENAATQPQPWISRAIRPHPFAANERAR